jgi:tetratricopeptide (TPR) repeat protein
LPARKKVIKDAEKPPQALRNSRHDNSATLYSQALALQKEGRLQEARKLYEAALQRSPRLVSALNNLGAIYIKEKNVAAARRVFEKAIRIDANYVDPYYNLACLHALQNDVGRSLFYLKKAVSVDEAARKWAETDEDLLNLRGHIQYEKIVKSAQKS